MHVFISLPVTQIDFIAARNFLKFLNYKPQTISEKLAWRILDPFCHLDNQIESLSLTDKMDYDNQIRFFLSERIDRMLGNITSRIAQKISSLDIQSTGELDEGSRRFFSLLSQKIPVKYQLNQTCLAAESQYQLEELMVNQLLTIDEPQKPELYVQLARRYLNIGNGWTAEKILRQLLKVDDSYQAAQLISFALNMQGRGKEAEPFYLKWFDSPLAEDKVRAAYVLSMLYARHHDSARRSQTTAKAYLETAFKILCEHSPETYQDHIFDSVFNRNGYALILFREGNLDEAEALLSWGIAQMKKHATPKERMHLSVLYFNIAQIYAKTKNWKLCLNAIDELIEIDPFFAEYHAEKARILIESNGDLGCAANEILKALELDPNVLDADTLYAYLYPLAESEQYHSILQIFETSAKVGFGMNDDLLILLAEALINLGRADRARDIATQLKNPDQVLSYLPTFSEGTHEKLSSAI